LSLTTQMRKEHADAGRASLFNLKIEEFKNLKIFQGMTKTFTEFEVYQKSIVLAKEVFRLMNNKSFERDMALRIRLKER